MLKCEKDQYSFRHLIFQEFLTAQYMADNYLDHIKVIRPYWEDEWYKEVAALYVSYLRIDYKKIANDIILAVLKDNDTPRISNGLLREIPCSMESDEHLNEQIADLTGNVWEWTGTGYYENIELGDAVFLEKAQELADQGDWLKSYKEYSADKEGLPVLRGGAWSLCSDLCRCAYRFRNHPIRRFSNVGFRCARALLKL